MNEAKAQMTCDAELVVTEESSSACSKTFSVTLNVGTENVLNSMAFKFDQNYVDFNSIVINSFAAGSPYDFSDNGSGQISFFKTIAVDISALDGLKIVEFEINDPEPDMCIDNYITSFSTVITGDPNTPCSISKGNTVTNPSTQSCFESEQVCGNIQKANFNCAQQNDNNIVGATVESDDGCGNPVSDDTNSSGNYCITVMDGECVTIGVDNSECPGCQSPVTETDVYYITQMRRMISGLTYPRFERAQQLAADLNYSGVVSTLDILALIFLEMGIEIFDIADCAFYAASELSETDLFFDDTVNSCVEQDFVMTVPGDINGNCNDCDYNDPTPTELVIDSIFEVRTVAGEEIVKIVKNVQTVALRFPTTSSFQSDDFEFKLSTEDYLFDSIWSNNVLGVLITPNDTSGTLPKDTDLFAVESTVTLSGYTQYAWEAADTIWYDFEFSGLGSKIAPESETNIALIQEADQLKVISEKETGKGRVFIYTMDGRPVATESFDNLLEGESLRVSLTNLQGLLFVRIESENVRRTQAVFIP